MTIFAGTDEQGRMVTYYTKLARLLPKRLAKTITSVTRTKTNFIVIRFLDGTHLVVHEDDFLKPETLATIAMRAP